MPVPIVLPAPGRLSTTTDCPHCSVSASATIRPTMSLPPPGASGTTTRTGLRGYFEGYAASPICAQPDVADAASSNAAQARATAIESNIGAPSGRCPNIAAADYRLVTAGANANDQFPAIPASFT